MKKTIIFIVGPTSSGKTACSIELADRINGEIISCDSMQVYKDMDLLTHPPSDENLLKAKHYLVKMISPEEEFNVSEFVNKSKTAIEFILSENKVPIIAGGTGLYMKSLVDGIFSSPPKDAEFREELEKKALEKGNEYLHERLKKVDPAAAEKLHQNDIKRIIRALEVYELTGETINEKKKDSEGIKDKYDCKFFGLSLPREVLYERINRSVDAMVENGLVDMVKDLRNKKLSRTADKALGVKEISSFLDGEIGFDRAIEELKKNTRRYAKRQLTWFRGDERVIWIDASRAPEEITNDILERSEL